MRRLSCCFLLLLLTLGRAGADPYNLEGGALIVHLVPDLAYSTEPPTGDWCTSYAPHAIDSCDAQVNRIDPAGPTRAVWYVLAAWYQEKTWCGVEFGLDHYDPALFTFHEFGPCFPAGGLEIPTGGWPGPGTGTALAATIEPWSGNYLPIYFFTGYAYSAPPPGVIALGPSPGSGFAGAANCETPPRAWPAFALGGLGVGTDGIFACPHEPDRGCCWVGENCYVTYEEQCELMGGHWVPPQYCFSGTRDCGGIGPPRICCIDMQCYFMVEQQCLDEGGEYSAEWDSCDGPICYPRVCCVGETCRLTTAPGCEGLGGVWHPEWSSCTPSPCAPHVCCVGDECYLMLAPDCEDLGGVWHLEWSSCTPNGCASHVCCIDEICQILHAGECHNAGGDWHLTWDSCDPNPCLRPHVCCIGLTCELLMDPDECAAMQGVWHPDWDTCAGNPCDTLPPLGACCVEANCTVLMEWECLTQGGVWMSTWDCDPNLCAYLPPPPRVCCVGWECVLVPTEQDCRHDGGYLLPFSPDCDPDPCRDPLPGCCYVGEDCFITLEYECVMMGGIWIPPDYCSESGRDCSVGPPRLCCLGEYCYFLVEQQCLDLGGTWHPGWDSCDPNPCGAGSPASGWTWGAIKAMYR